VIARQGSESGAGLELLLDVVLVLIKGVALLQRGMDSLSSTWSYMQTSIELQAIFITVVPDHLASVEVVVSSDGAVEGDGVNILLPGATDPQGPITITALSLVLHRNLSRLLEVPVFGPFFGIIILGIRRWQIKGEGNAGVRRQEA